MMECDHDTRICVHIMDALDNGAKKVYVRTADTDVIVVLVGFISELQKKCTDIDVWVAFGMGRHFHFFCQHLGEWKSKALPYFHAFTGCDTNSQFLGKGKKSAWTCWKSLDAATEAFLHAFLKIHFSYWRYLHPHLNYLYLSCE